MNNSGDILRFASGVAGLGRGRGGRSTRSSRDFVASPNRCSYVDSSGLIRRHDYTAEVVGGWARAAHHLSAHRQVDDLTFPTRRRVRPIGVRNRTLPGPTLVWIELDALGIQKG
jgi:hypothetical protein